MTLKQRLSLWLISALLLILMMGALKATTFGTLAAYFPVAVAGVGALLAALEIVLMRVDGSKAAPAAVEPAQEDAAIRRDISGGALNLLWLALYVVGMVTAGFLTATIAFLFLMLWKGAKYSPAKAALLSLAFCIFVDVFGAYIGLIFPSGFVDRAILGLFEA